MNHRNFSFEVTYGEKSAISRLDGVTNLVEVNDEIIGRRYIPDGRTTDGVKDRHRDDGRPTFWWSVRVEGRDRQIVRAAVRKKVLRRADDTGRLVDFKET